MKGNTLSQTTKPRCCRGRSPIYFFSFILLVIVTILIIVALSTNNWQRSIQTYQNTETSSYRYTMGLWSYCQVFQNKWNPMVQPNNLYPTQFNTLWNGQPSIFCNPIDVSTGASWIIASQVFYTLATALNILASILSFYGIFKDMSERYICMPQFVFWMLFSSCIFQIIAISVYGSMGISDRSQFVPDYSIIIASVSVCFNAVTTFFFFIELVFTYRDFSN